MVTTELDIVKIKDEFVNKFRYGINQYDNLSRITETTTTFNGDGSETKFLLSATRMSYIKSVSIGGVAQTFVTDYDITWRDEDIGKVIFVTAPIAGTDNVSIVWGQITTNSANFVHPDFPRTDLSTHSYPRIGFQTTLRSDIAGLGGGTEIPFKHDVLIQIKIVDIDTHEIDYLANKISNWIKQNVKNFHYITYIKPVATQEYNDYDDNTEEAHSKVIEFICPDKYEIVIQS